MITNPSGQPWPVVRFMRQCLQLEPDPMCPDGALLKDEHTQNFLYESLFAPGRVSHPAPPRYQLKVLKSLVTRIEEAIDDWNEHGISDELMSALSDLMLTPVPSETAAAQQKCYVTYYQSSPRQDQDPVASTSPTITLLESRSLISAAGTTGLRTWEASLHLGQYLCTNPSVVRHRRVLELGAGTGYLSVLCTKHLGARHVVASDGSDDVVSNLPESLFINGLQGSDSIEPMDLKWGHALVGTEEQQWNAGREVDLVLGADITYDKGLIPALVGTLAELTSMFPRAHILISATERNRETFDRFLDTSRMSGFTVELIEFPIPEAGKQAGPFYDARIPIHICKLVRHPS